MNLALKGMERRENENELQDLNEILDRFVYSCSHDLKGPLTSIKGLLRLAEISNRQEATSECLQLIDESVERMDKFLHSLEAYVGNARSPVLRNEVDFKSLVAEILKKNKVLIDEKKIRVSQRIVQNHAYKSDAVRVKMILTNLIENAIYFQDNTKAERFIDIEILVNENDVHIEVCDNGVGISKDIRHKVYRMFFRASEASKGSGLGLFLAKEAVKKLTGTIQFESSRGVGTNFTVILPRIN